MAHPADARRSHLGDDEGGAATTTGSSPSGGFTAREAPPTCRGSAAQQLKRVERIEQRSSRSAGTAPPEKIHPTNLPAPRPPGCVSHRDRPTIQEKLEVIRRRRQPQQLPQGTLDPLHEETWLPEPRTSGCAAAPQSYPFDAATLDPLHEASHVQTSLTSRVFATDDADEQTRSPRDDEEPELYLSLAPQRSAAMGQPHIIKGRVTLKI